MLQSESGGLGTKVSGEPVCVGHTPHKCRKDSCIAENRIAALNLWEGSHAGLIRMKLWLLGNSEMTKNSKFFCEVSGAARQEFSDYTYCLHDQVRKS